MAILDVSAGDKRSSLLRQGLNNCSKSCGRLGHLGFPSIFVIQSIAWLEIEISPFRQRDYTIF